MPVGLSQWLAIRIREAPLPIEGQIKFRPDARIFAERFKPLACVFPRVVRQFDRHIAASPTSIQNSDTPVLSGWAEPKSGYPPERVIQNHPTLPSRLTLSSFWASTANSIGRV